MILKCFNVNWLLVALGVICQFAQDCFFDGEQGVFEGRGGDDFSILSGEILIGRYGQGCKTHRVR